jgi:hypothetical protein
MSTLSRTGFFILFKTGFGGVKNVGTFLTATKKRLHELSEYAVKAASAINKKYFSFVFNNILDID